MVPNTEVTFYACARKQSHHEVVTEKSVSAVCIKSEKGDFDICQLCVTICVQVHESIKQVQVPLSIKRSVGVAQEMTLRNPFHAGDEACKRGNPPWL